MGPIPTPPTEDADLSDATLQAMARELIARWRLDPDVVRHIEQAHQALSLAVFRIRANDFRSSPRVVVARYVEEALDHVSRAYCDQWDSMSGDEMRPSAIDAPRPGGEAHAF